MSIRIDGTNTTANPGITGTDTDTGLQFGTNEVKVVTDGTAKATVDSSGNVGIGITSPTLSNNSTGIHIHGSGSGGSRLHLTDSNTGTTKSDGTEIVVSGSDLYIDQKENASTIFYTNGSERARILSSGGITFNGDTAAANALDDYEEGTWTPVPNFGGGTTGITYATAPTGNYTKIGNLVFIVMGFQFSNKGSSTGSFVVSGLPYSVASTGSFKHPNSVVNAHNMTNNNKVYAALGSGSTINYRRISDSNTDAVPGDGDFQNNSGFYHSLVYVT